LARKILLADDSVTAQNMGRKILADAGYDVVTVNNGSAALKRITELKPDLIVLDVYMPGYSGLEVCQRLKDAAETARIPVLLTVGKLEPFKPEEARRVRADAHIVKPFEASELLTAIARLEDRMAPPHAGETEAPADDGWMSRLSFPSKKKKNGEAEEVAAGAAFRDFRKGKGKDGAAEFAVKTAPAAEAPSPIAEIPPDIPLEVPPDITPEELDALSALAAKLDAPPDAPPDASSDDNSAPAEDSAATAKTAVESAAPVVDSAAAIVGEEFAVEPAAPAVEGNNEFEIPVKNLEPSVESAPIVTVSTAGLAEEPAPVDGNDEPMFASAVGAVEHTAEEGMAGKAEAAEPTANDTELAEALRLLTPTTEPANLSMAGAQGNLPSEEVVAGRWVAEPVALSPEEAAISLEAEMFRTFASMPEALTVSGAELESSPMSGVSAITATVENRLAEAELAARSKASTNEAESCSDESGAEATAEQASAEIAPAEAMAAVSQVAGGDAETAHNDSALVAEQVAAEAVLATTQEVPKAMAAAATDGAASAKNAREIANIVDSVLADLRPKLLEEIAKKLAGK
jgi:CheY-like chemotaxis protein